MSISIQLMRNFVEVARCGSISLAANHVGLTQPALSSAIKNLEHQLKAALFIRSKKGVSLTRAGKILLERSESLLRDWERLTSAIDLDNKDISGRYTMGIHPTLASVTLNKFLPALMHDHQDLTFTFEHLRSQQIIEKILNLELDFGIIINPPNHAELNCINLFDDQLKFYQSKQKTKKSKRAQEPNILVYNPSMYQCEVLLEQAYKKHLFPNMRTLHIDDLTVIASLIAAGIGYGVLPKLIVTSQYADSIKEVKNSPVHLDRCCLVSRKRIQTSAAFNTIQDAIVNSFTTAP